jgi:hypothetical protein
VFFKRKTKDEYDGLRLVKAVMPNFAGMYAEILRDNDIPFIARQEGVAGYMKIVTGGLLIPENFYVKSQDYDKALELYNAFIEIEEEN